MTSSDPDNEAASELLTLLTDLLAEETLRHRIDEPVDAALAEYKHPETSECSQEVFHRNVADLLVHLRDRAWATGKGRAAASLDDAISLLEREYRGTYFDGYDGALQDTVDPSLPGLELVLARMAEAVKTQCRRTYIQWIMGRYVTCADYDTRCSLTALLMDRCREWLPQELQRCPPEQMVGCIPELLSIELSMRRGVQSELADLFAGPR